MFSVTRLRENGFWYWWTRNYLEPLGGVTSDSDGDAAEATAPLAPIPAYLPPLGVEENIDEPSDT